MHIKLVLYCCLCITALSSGTNKCKINVEGYYWRDYDGTIPPDALKGGVDSKGRTLYIAKILFAECWLPGCIYEGNPTAYFEYGAPQQNVYNVMILCTKNPEKFEWVKVSGGFDKITGRHIMLSGFEPYSLHTAIARAPVTSELTIGKALSSRYDNVGFWGARDGVREHLLDYEVLIFNRDFCNTINY